MDKRKVKCEVIQDLLPLYVEDMASAPTRELVEEHLADCEVCRKQAEQMRGGVMLPKDTDTKLLERLQRKLLRKKETAAVISALGVVLLFVLLGIHMQSPVVIPYEKIKDSMSVRVEENGEVAVTLMEKAAFLDVEQGKSERGDEEVCMAAYTTRWDQIFKRTKGTEVCRFGSETARIYYYASEEQDEAVCIYPGGLNTGSSGMVVLPRLNLNYYALLAALLTGVGAVCCVIVRRKDRKHHIAAKLTLIPFSYLLASVLVLTGKGEIYVAKYYFGAVLLAAAVLYLMGYWTVTYLSGKRKKKNSVDRFMYLMYA